MTPENAHIVIRKRATDEIFSLAFRFLGRYFFQILLAGILALPFCILPWCIYYIAVMINSEWIELFFTNFDMGAGLWRYTFFCVLMFWWVGPLLTAPLTLLMGQLVFEGRADWRKLRREYFESLPQILYYKYFCCLFTFHWAFCNEVILLERNPWKVSHKTERRTTAQRCRDIYRRDYDSVFRILVSFLWISCLAGATFCSILALRQIILGGTGDDFFAYSVFLYTPGILWGAYIYYSVIRFLAYLNFRICSEGWDLDLKIREECAQIDHGRMRDEENEF
ncbi:MAG: hypothetical protein Q4C96_07600 [Planctomycetia bacterium]|nr:hypothetical protein [Planctomycetia bacterium]